MTLENIIINKKEFSEEIREHLRDRMVKLSKYEPGNIYTVLTLVTEFINNYETREQDVIHETINDYGGVASCIRMDDKYNGKKVEIRILGDEE